MNEIKRIQIGDKNKTPDQTLKDKGNLSTYTTDNAKSPFPRADELKLGLFDCFESNKDICLRILNEAGSLKQFRLTCRKAALVVLQFWQLHQCLVKLYPNNFFEIKELNITVFSHADRSIILQPTAENELDNEINEKKLKFAEDNKFLYKLLLSCEFDLRNFYKIPLQKAQMITTLAVTCLDNSGMILFGKILKQICDNQNSFINLKSLQTTKLGDLSTFSIPNSIKHFESCKITNPQWYALLVFHHINISNLENLESITLESLEGNFKIKKLPQLESITFRQGPFRDIKIKLKECPKLTSIIVQGENVLFDKTLEYIIIKGLPLPEMQLQFLPQSLYPERINTAHSIDNQSLAIEIAKILISQDHEDDAKNNHGKFHSCSII